SGGLPSNTKRPVNVPHSADCAAAAMATAKTIDAPRNRTGVMVTSCLLDRPEAIHRQVPNQQGQPANPAGWRDCLNPRWECWCLSVLPAEGQPACHSRPAATGPHTAKPKYKKVRVAWPS